MERLVKSGTGWRLGWDPNPVAFKGLVGGEDWALELTEAELNDFCRLVTQVSKTIQQMASELMDEEKITCEVESELLWLEAAGYPQRYQLRVIVLTGRRGEGAWSVEAVPGLVQAAESLTVF